MQRAIEAIEGAAPPVAGRGRKKAAKAVARRKGGTYRDSWDDAEMRTYNLNTARDRDNDGHACE